jgi:CRISPR-associated exonuclease Cas4
VLKYNLVDKISPTLIKQYSYCPVIVWIQIWFNVQEPLTDSMTIGRESIKPPKGKGQIYISTSRGATIIDEVLENSDYKILVERKAYKSHNYSRYIEQVVTSYIIAREKIHGIRRVKLIVQDSERELELSEDLVKDVENITKLVEEVLKNEKPPVTKPDLKKCISCWYKRYCPHN